MVSITEAEAASQFLAFVESEPFPCVGAKAALVQKNVRVNIYDHMCAASSQLALYLDLMNYAQQIDLADPRITSFVAIFSQEPIDLEAAFETKLWKLLSGISNLDASLGIPWHASVAADPNDPGFSMSLAGHPFFVIGMHPGSNRRARRSPHSTLVFNSHLQFEKLRQDGRFDEMKAIIRERDDRLNGSVNPMLADHGTISEARQYSGRAVDETWVCPFATPPNIKNLTRDRQDDQPGATRPVEGD